VELFRQINQNKIKGNIFLHSLPGLYETLEEVNKELQEYDITKIFCLTSKPEIRVYSPEYLKALENGQLDNTDIIYNPVPDFGIPESEKTLSDYYTTLSKAYEHLKVGNILVHCTGGIGRTGTFAVILLRIIGYAVKEALQITRNNGSGPESPEQKDFCQNYRNGGKEI
jgi:protein-tyrosine phosphatase